MTNFFLSFKRTAKKPSVLIMLFATAVCTLLCGFLSEDDGIPNCGIVSGNDQNAMYISEMLVSDGFIPYENGAALIKGIERGEVASGFVFPDDFTERIEDCDLDEALTFYESPSAFFPSIYKYRAVSRILNVYAPYITSRLLSYEGLDIPPEVMRSIIDEYIAKDEEFKFTVANAEGAPVEVSHYSQKLALGALALFLFFAFGLFAVPYTEVQFLPLVRRIGLKKALLSYTLPSILSVMLLFFTTSAAALVASEFLFASGMSALILPTAIYTVFLSALGVAIAAIFGSTENARVPIMAICLMSVAFCPIFVDIPSIIGLPLWPKWFLPPMFLYAAIDNVVLCAIVAILTFAAAFALYAFMYKKKLKLK